jgi:hypothetical protein
MPPKSKRSSSAPALEDNPAEKKVKRAVSEGVQFGTLDVAVELHRLVNIITDMWSGIHQAPTLTVKQGASLPYFDQKEFHKKMQDDRSYKCACSAFAL